MKLFETREGDKELLEIANLYPNTCYCFFYALAGAHRQSPGEKPNELFRLIQNWCEEQKKILTVGEI